LLLARGHKERELVQTQQTLQHYQALGDGFASVAGEYREVLAETDNKQWALGRTQQELAEMYACHCSVVHVCENVTSNIASFNFGGIKVPLAKQ